MDSIVVKTRDLIEDNFRRNNGDTFEYITSKIFTLSEANVDATSISVEKNGAVFAPANYTYSSTTGKLTVTGTLVAGDILVVSYNYYYKYSDTEIEGYIRGALYWLTTEKYKVFACRNNVIFPTPSEEEECLIALIASILITDSIKSYRTPEISIQFEDSMSKEEKISRAVSQFDKMYGIFKYINLDEDIDPPYEAEQDEDD